VNAPVLFLPTLPEAKAIAKATWAKDPTAPKRAVELDETIREVSALQDVWIGSLVKKWQVRARSECCEVPSLLTAHCTSLTECLSNGRIHVGCEQAPDPTVKAASQLRGGFSRNKGRAPQASQFRNIVTPSSRNLNSRGGPASPHSPQSQFINIVAAPASAPQVRSRWHARDGLLHQVSSHRDGRPTPQVLSLFVPKVQGSSSKPKLP